jgi:hypothetical protein
MRDFCCCSYAANFVKKAQKRSRILINGDDEVGFAECVKVLLGATAAARGVQGL